MFHVPCSSGRWNSLLEQISDQLKVSKSLSGLWRRYEELHEGSRRDVQRLEERAEHLHKSATRRDISEDEIKAWMSDCHVRFTYVYTCDVNTEVSNPRFFLHKHFSHVSSHSLKTCK